MSGIELMAKIQDLKPEMNAIFMTAFDADYVKSDLGKYSYKVAEIFQQPCL